MSDTNAAEGAFGRPRWVGRAIAVVAVAVLLAAAGAGCSLLNADETSWTEKEALLQLQTPTSVWWTGAGDYAVLQTVGKDGRPVVAAWNRKTLAVRTYPHYRVVDVEPHEPRFWVVPDSRIVPWSIHDRAAPHVVDIAGDGVDSPPAELYVVRLDGDAKPRSDVDARWAGWSGGAQYSASVEIDVNKGACPSTLRFYATGGSLNAWAAKVPTDVVTFEPIGWSPSGLHFAVITQADASRTAGIVAAWTEECKEAVKTAEAASRAAGDKPVDIETPPPPTWEADILVFSAADGALAVREKVTMPILEPNAGANLAAWSGTNDILFYFHQTHDQPTLGALKPFVEIEAKDPFALLSAQPARFAWFAGLDKEELVVGRMADGGGTYGDIRIWRIAGGSLPADVGPAKGTVTARWSPRGGMLSLSGLEVEPRWTVYVSRTVGGPAVKAFSVEPPSGPLQPN